MRKRFVTGQKVVIGEEREPSAIYGAEHLLRMLGKMTDRFVSVSPQMVASSAMDGVCDSSEGLCEQTIIVS